MNLSDSKAHSFWLGAMLLTLHQLNDFDAVCLYFLPFIYTDAQCLIDLFWYKVASDHIDGFVQYCSNSIANAMELLQSCTKPSNRYCFLNTE